LEPRKLGDIKKLLSAREIEPRQITATSVWTDLCENVHFHYRNIRLEFSEKEFAAFRAAVHHLGKAVEFNADRTNYAEGDPMFLSQQAYKTPLKANSDYYPNRVTIEFERDNTVHFHYRDLRLHWSLSEFVEIANMFIKAKDEYANLKEFPDKDITNKRVLKFVDIDLIQPYDKGHKPLAEDQEHKDGIEYVKKLIQKGKKIRPILINTDGQRLDGYKRYMAFKQLGYKQIECIIEPNGFPGGQQNEPLIADED
jgi:hypothetical protein